MKKKKRRLSFFGIAVFIITAVIAGSKAQENLEAAKLQQGIAEQIIRFHVRANSDSEADQQLKLLVKDEIVTYLQPLLAGSESLEQSKEILSEQREQICELARGVLKEAGSDYEVCAYFEESYFPMKTYGDFTFPPGEYEAFRVDIGEHEGKNWWCVLYPPLCFVDSVYGVLPEESKETLKSLLTEDEYNTINNSNINYEFKYLTFLNGIAEKF